ncbi:rplP [Symbiodinium natans]|uniref:RplP protein n=1 Tax=Symbiodinium natans TaxID=878477 RepID=A0A812RDE6_9DINO|nr:rplP [Symbiodinium natans]
MERAKPTTAFMPSISDLGERLKAVPLLPATAPSTVPGTLLRDQAFAGPCSGVHFTQASFWSGDNSPQAQPNQFRTDGQAVLTPIGQSFGNQDNQAMSPTWQPHKVYLPQGLTSAFLVVGEAHQDMVPSPNSQSSPIHVQAIPMPVGTPMQRDCQAVPLAPGAALQQPVQRNGQAYPMTAMGAPAMPMRDCQAFPMQGNSLANPMLQEGQTFVVAHTGPNAAPLQREWQAYPMPGPCPAQKDNKVFAQMQSQSLGPVGQMPLEGQVTAPLPPGVPSEGSIGHPELCRRPCFYFAKGTCTNGLECGYCHAQHGEKAPKLDKRQRLVLQSLPENMLLEMLVSRVQEKAEEKRMTAAMTDIMDLWHKRLEYLSVNPPVVSPEDAENLAERYVRNLDKILRRMNISELIALAIRSAKEEQAYVSDLREALSRLRTKVPPNL